MVARKISDPKSSPKLEPEGVEEEEEKILGAAGTFTGLWALTWLGASVMGAGAAIQGGFAVGGVMAGSGLTVLWWKMRALKHLAEEEAARDFDEPETGLDPPTESVRHS